MISRSQHLWNLLLHTRLPRHPLSREERRQSAVNALLAFNVMVRQGDTALATDAKQYTRLIWLMARGGLEWQAYKFFARMLDQGVTPLPATYAALRAATAPSRKTLIQALERKMQEVVLSYPNELARENEKLVAEVTENAEQECTLLSNIENVRVLLQCNTTGEQSHATTQKGNTLLEHDAETNPVVHSSAQSDAAGSSSAYVTVSIDSPPLTWDVFNQYTEKKRLLMSEEKMTLDRTALPEKQKELFRMRLARLSEEELRVILTMHRQFRHGDKDVLLKRVLAYVPYKDIERILKRREAYFQDLRNQLEGIMSAVSASQHTTDLQNNNYDGEYPTDSVDINGNDQFVSKSLTPNEMFLSPREQFEMKPERIPLPWGGVIKKPLHPSEHDVASVSNSSRDVALTSEEVHLVESSVWSQALDLVPTPLLRRYARMFDIMWARDLGEQVQMGTAPCGGLHDRIEFFVRNKEKILREDVPEGFEDLGSAADKPLSDPICTTMGHRPQKDPPVSGSADTICVEEKMHAFDVFNAVARYALEAQVVDDKETNRALLRDRQLRGRTSHAPRNWNPMVSPQGTMQPDTTRASSAGAQVGQMPDFPGNPPLLVGVNHKDHEQHVPERVRITPSMAASGVLSVEDVKRGEVVMDRVDEDTPSVVDGWVRLVQERRRRRQESERKSDESHSASTRRDERLLSEEQQVLSHKEKARARTAARIINQDASRVLLGEASSSPQWASGETELQSVLNPVRDGAILEIGGGRYHSWKERRDGHRRIDRAQQALSVYEPKDSIERRYKRKKMAILKLRKKVLSKKEEERKLKKNVFIPKKQRMMWNVTIPKT